MAHEHSNPPDGRLHMVAVMRAVAERDGQALHALLYDMPAHVAEAVIDYHVAIDDRRAEELGRRVVLDLDLGRERWLREIAKRQALEVARYAAEQGGDTIPDQA